ncbi:competence protein ComK [Mangrovibacillus cuniculi]|uniref:Transcriptional regulator n=1 Tax=Mangrovibacillus cuniculi TaxID=2593652 RepID=A0A7S8C9U2_9BACI|nr:competence protein ComK [Mangrovibacillus cuniculi]QPC46017.1 transcriptional regulator [Mangrovibacillus cuniculi]
MSHMKTDRKHISGDVMLLRPLEYGHRIFTEVISAQGSFLNPMKPIDVIKFSCEYYGSSLDGRIHGTKNMIQVTKKCPIMISPESDIFMFPTKSPFHPQCIWVAVNHVTHYQSTPTGETSVTFTDKKVIQLPISYASFEQQMRKTAMLQISYLNRQEKSKKQQSFLITKNSRSPFHL